MKPIKTFTISFLVLSFLSLSITVALTFLRENEKALRIAAEDQIANLESEKTVLTNEADRLRQDNSNLQKQLDFQTKLATDLKQELAGKDQAHQEELNKVKKEFGDFKDSSTRMLQEYQKQNKELLDKVQQLEKEMSSKRRKGSEPEDLSSPSGAVELPTVVVKGDRTFTGRVMVVNRNFNFIITNIGKNQGLEIGDTLQVLRSNQKIATVKVEKLYDTLSASGIIDEDPGLPIQEGDNVAGG